VTSSRKPKFSIVIPTLNQGDFIEETIHSVLDQHGVDVEVIVIDGGSSDQTLEIIKRYESHFKYWVSEKDSGQSDAINKGMRHISGDIVNWLNSDDVLKPNALSSISEAWRSSKGEATCFFGGTELRLGSKDLGQFVFPQRHKDFSKVAICTGGYQPAIYFSAEVFKSLLPLDETLHFSMDFDLWIRYLAKFGTTGIHYLDEVLVSYRLHENSKTVSQAARFSSDNFSIARRIANSLHRENMQEVFKELEYGFQKLPPSPPTNRYSFSNLSNDEVVSVVKELLTRSLTPVKSKDDFSLLIKLWSLKDKNAFASHVISHSSIASIVAHRYWWAFRLAQYRDSVKKLVRSKFGRSR
jgi:glycosyltransferase involved in cell wall biosynthesis